MKKIAVRMLLVLLIAVTVLSGCGGAGGKGTVYYLNPNPEADDTWQTLASCYTQQTGVEVRVVTVETGDYGAFLSGALVGDKAPTLFQCNSPRELEQWGEYCLDFTDTALLQEMTTQDFNLVDSEGAVKAIGYSYEAFGIIVNKGLLQQAGYEIGHITDFAALKAVAEDIHARSGALGFDAFVSPDLGGASWIESGSPADAPWYCRLLDIPLHYEFREDKITEQPPTIKGTYLDGYRNILDLITGNSPGMPVDLTGTADERELDAFGSCKAAFWVQGTGVYANLVGDPYRMNPDDLQMIPVFCGVPGEENSALCCAMENGWSVNAKAGEADIQATLDFLSWVVSSDEGTAAMTRQFGTVPFQGAKTTEHVFFADANRLLAAGKEPVNRMIQDAPDTDQWRLGVVSSLTDYMAGHGTWSAVKSAVVEGWAKQSQPQDR